MRRFGRKLDVDRLRGELPLTPFFFDLLHLDGDDPAGMALRFARVKRYREDKTAAEADTIETVRQIFAAGRVGGT